MSGPKRSLDNLSQSWGALRITAKFGLAFGLLLLILLMQTLIAGAALGVAWGANTSIQESTEIQRLAMVMSRNWETVRRLEHSFFIQAPLIGAEQAYQLYALPASGKIAEVVRDGATLKRLSSAPEAGATRRAHGMRTSVCSSPLLASMQPCLMKPPNSNINCGRHKAGSTLNSGKRRRLWKPVYKQYLGLMNYWFFIISCGFMKKTT